MAAKQLARYAAQKASKHAAVAAAPSPAPTSRSEAPTGKAEELRESRAQLPLEAEWLAGRVIKPDYQVEKSLRVPRGRLSKSPKMSR
jgi:hypothetical protein